VLSWPHGERQTKNQDGFKMNKIDFAMIQAQTGREYKLRAIQTELSRVGVNNVAISDCLVNADRDGLVVMRTLHDHFRQNRDLRYKIKVLKDMWGKPVAPGELVRWKFGRRTRDAFGRKYTQDQIKAYTRRGELGQIEIWHDATVDANGCITVGFEDAAILISERGIHYESKAPITRMPEKRDEPTYDRYDRDTRKLLGFQHYWLYEEVPNALEAGAPVDLAKRTYTKRAES
jgi:hypothetical protein